MMKVIIAQTDGTVVWENLIDNTLLIYFRDGELHVGSEASPSISQDMDITIQQL